MIRGLALEGGGVAAIAHIGSAQVLEEKGYYNQLTHVIGSSAGSMVAGLIACRIPVAKLKEIMMAIDYAKLQDSTWLAARDIYRLINEYGWNRSQLIEDLYGEILQKEVGDRDITYRGVKEKFGTYLITTSTNLNTEGTIYRNPDTSPDLPIRRGIRESTSIPLFYSPVISEGVFYVDGGTLNNYPIRKLYDYLPIDQVVGLKLISKTDRTVEKNINNLTTPPSLVSYVKLIVKMLHDQNLKVHVKKEDWARTVAIDVGKISATDYGLTDQQKLELIANGVTAAKEFFSKN